MTKSSQQNRKKRTYVLVRHGKIKRKTFVSRKNVQSRKSIRRSIGIFKQLYIIKRGQKVFSTLQFKDLPNEVVWQFGNGGHSKMWTGFKKI